MAPGDTTRSRTFRRDLTGSSEGLSPEFLELYHTRLRLIGIIGWILVPVSVYLELVYVWLSPVEADLPHLLAIRGSWGLMFFVCWLILRRGSLPFHTLRFLDWVLFVGSCAFQGYLGLILGGIDAAYFCGVLMITYLRAFYIPGGLRLTLPIMAGSIAAYPIATWGMTFVHPEYAAQFADPVRFADFVMNSLLGFACSVVAVFGVVMVDKLQRQAFQLQRISRYHIDRKLGEGGMGVVYLAEHGILKSPVAIKLLGAHHTVDDAARKRFETEARHTSRLIHPNTIRIYDFGATDDGTLYYAMEYIEGVDLAKLVNLWGVPPTERTVHLIVQACRSLQHAHEHRVIHRDVKPANFVISGLSSQPDHLKVLDFGLAKILEDRNPSEDSVTLEASQANVLKGTPLYMSPEQCRGDRVDARSDIYSLGCVLYFLLTGKPTFQADSWLKVLALHAAARPKRPSELNPAVRPDLDAVVLRCLAKDPRDRFQTVDALREALSVCRDYGAWTEDDAREWWSAQETLDAMAEEADVSSLDLAVNTTVHLKASGFIKNTPRTRGEAPPN